MTERPDHIIDGDGHICERDDEIHPFLDPKFHDDGIRNFYFFPTLDGWMRGLGGSRGRPPMPHPDAEEYCRFLEDSGIAASVIYPTAGLGYGFLKDKEWARELARGYNNFLYGRYLEESPRLKGVALIPVQDPPSAARELRRAVKDLGAVGGLLPAVGLRIPYGDSAFDVLYEEAESLNVMLAIHGAPQQGLGFDFFDDSRASGVLGHPFSQMVQFTSMVSAGVFARFPHLKVAFLEAGCGWVPFLLERLDDRFGGGAVTKQVRNSPLYFHAELDQASLPYVASVIGDDHLIYASDYPHEGVTADTAVDELDTFFSRQDLSAETKVKMVGANVEALYGLSGV